MKHDGIYIEASHASLLLDAAAFPVILLDLDLKLDMANKSAEALFGEAIKKNKSFNDFCEATGLDCAFFGNIASVLSKKTLKYYTSYVEREGRSCKYHVAILRCFDKFGKHEGYFFLMRPDEIAVEEKKKSEEEVDEKAVQQVVKQAQPKATVPTEPVKRKTNVLLVEDEGMTQRVVRSFLDQLGCAVDVASTAKQAWNSLQKLYDIILLDIGLPDKDGIALARDIRQKKMMEMPIVALTGYTWDENVYYEVGIDTVVRKPVSKDKLSKILEDFISPPLNGHG